MSGAMTTLKERSLVDDDDTTLLLETTLEPPRSGDTAHLDTLWNRTVRVNIHYEHLDTLWNRTVRVNFIMNTWTCSVTEQ